MQGIYSSPSYSMGNVSASEHSKAEKEIRRMRSSLKSWLKFRNKNDKAAKGMVKTKVPAEVIAKTLPNNRDWRTEQKLALSLHALLSEVMDSNRLPDPDITKDPDAAVKLARIAIYGKLPSESQSASAQGLFWLWPATVVVGLLLVTIITKIRSDADVAKESERLECIKMGACTDTNFYIKIAAIGLAAYFIYDKTAVGRKIKKYL